MASVSGGTKGYGAYGPAEEPSTLRREARAGQGAAHGDVGLDLEGAEHGAVRLDAEVGLVEADLGDELVALGARREGDGAGAPVEREGALDAVAVALGRDGGGGEADGRMIARVEDVGGE